jgi:5'-3' exonuclease
MDLSNAELADVKTVSDERKENRQRMMECIQLLEGSKLEQNAANIEFLEQNWDLVQRHMNAMCQCNGHSECFIGQFLSKKINSDTMLKVKDRVNKSLKDENTNQKPQSKVVNSNIISSDKSVICVLDELLNKLKDDTVSLFTLLKDEDGVEKFKIETMSKLYMMNYPQLEEWQAIMLYFMRTNPDFKEMVNEIAEASPETRKEFFDLVKEQQLLQ